MAFAQSPTTKYDTLKEQLELRVFEARDARGEVTGTLPYRIFLPEPLCARIAAGEDVSADIGNEAATKYPLIVFLHGAGERGDDNKKQLAWPEVLRFVSDEAPRPAILIAPQCPEGQSWSRIQGLMNTDDPTPPMKLLFGLLDELDRTLPIEPLQRYITGLSMGGFGSFAACGLRPDYFAAAMPICGGMASPEFVNGYAGTAFRIFHGGADGVVKPEFSRDAVKLLEEHEISVQYTEYPGVDHNSWSAAYAEPDLVKWLFAQKRPKP